MSSTKGKWNGLAEQVNMTKTTDNMQMARWIARNCRFAMSKQAGIVDFIGRDALNRMISNPEKGWDILFNAYVQRMRAGDVFAELSDADVRNDLATLDARIYPGQGPMLNTPLRVKMIIDINKEVARMQAEREMEDPFDRFRRQRMPAPISTKAPTTVPTTVPVQPPR